MIRMPGTAAAGGAASRIIESLIELRRELITRRGATRRAEG